MGIIHVDAAIRHVAEQGRERRAPFAVGTGAIDSLMLKGDLETTRLAPKGLRVHDTVADSGAAAAIGKLIRREGS